MSISIDTNWIVSVVLLIGLGATLTQIFVGMADQLSGKIIGTEYPPDRIEEVLGMRDRSFDFIVVGAGSAGSVVASRLSEIGEWSVLLIEAGHDPYFFSEIPGATPTLVWTDMDWGYVTEPQSRACLGMKNQRCPMDKGKCLGGSSVLNYMIYVPGNKRDYDNWAAMGNEGWSYDEVEQFFKKSQEMQPDYIEKYGSEEFGAHGPLHIRKANSTFIPIENIVLDGLASLGFPILETSSPRNQIGFGLCHQTMDNGKRFNVAKGYLAPIGHRSNLYVMKNTQCIKVIVEDNVAKGVVVAVPGGDNYEIYAKREVIMSAGSIGSPQILMLSGIGPQHHLEELGIEVVADLPVGQNLQDHQIWWGPGFTYDNGTNSEILLVITALVQYLKSSTGFLAALPGVDLNGFLNLDDPRDDFPNIQFTGVVIPQKSRFITDALLLGVSFGEELKNQFRELVSDGDVFLFAPIVVHPKSVGELKLKSSKASAHPLLYMNYLTHPDDVELFVRSLQILRDLAETKTFKENGLRFSYLKTKACLKFDENSREFWECELRRTANTLWHAVGTAKMGPRGDPTSVVDPQLRVIGIDRLRVADGSIMPKITSGNTNAPIVMIGEKASDMIKRTWL